VPCSRSSKAPLNDVSDLLATDLLATGLLATGIHSPAFTRRIPRIGFRPENSTDRIGPDGIPFW
jgi:hypothetical protein